MISLPENIVLGSASPRRKEILSMAGFNFSVLNIHFDETWPEHILWNEIPVFLAREKARHVPDNENEILLTADTLVFLDKKPVGKPADKDDAFEMLQRLSGRMHTVITGVCVRFKGEYDAFSDTSNVYFKEFDMKELQYYVDHFNCLDKAGAYGVQDWIGMIGIERIEGSFYNVMGLPIHLVYEKLKNLANK